MKRSLHFLIGIGALTITGCDYYGRTEAVRAYYHRPGIEQTFTYGARDGTFPAVVVGNPFAGEKAALDRAVVDAMSEAYRGAPTRFIATPADGARPYIRIVMLFDPPITANGGAACRNPSALPSAPTGERMRILAAFCSGDDVMSDVVASAPAVTSPGDPVFRRAVAAVMRDIVPIQSPDQGGNCANNTC
ncbi:MAG: hypothetical protein EXQ86_08140 [Rhodospirillales bacterium]|nr:hypothetical protein [Rhodospirillales bacterium]